MITPMLNRRRFLGSSLAMIPLPFLESFMVGRASAAVKAPSAAKRMVFLGMGFGVTKSSWYPDQEDTGVGYQLPKGLSPLAKHKDGFSVVQNLTHRHSRDGHAGSTFWLTGADQYAVAGKEFHNTISVDQVAAEQFGLETRFSSLQFTGAKAKGAGAGHGPGLSLSWDRDGKPMNALQNPNEIFHRLFSNPNVSIEQQRANIANQRSVLDTVFADVKSMRKFINQYDKDKLEEYVQSLRDIEIRLAKEESWIGVPKQQPQKAISEPSLSLNGREEVRIIQDLMVAAMQVDATRVMSYRMPADTFLQSIGIQKSSHAVSHYTEKDERKADSEKRDLAHAQLLSEFFDKLKASKESDGSNLFDNTVVSFGSNLSFNHNLDNCPSLVAGGGAGFKQGQNIVMKNETPLCNLWLSILQGSGVNIDQFSDSNGVIEDLMG